MHFCFLFITARKDLNIGGGGWGGGKVQDIGGPRHDRVCFKLLCPVGVEKSR